MVQLDALRTGVCIDVVVVVVTQRFACDGNYTIITHLTYTTVSLQADIVCMIQPLTVHTSLHSPRGVRHKRLHKVTWVYQASNLPRESNGIKRKEC
jgi:hypothetical protein